MARITPRMTRVSAASRNAMASWRCWDRLPAGASETGSAGRSCVTFARSARVIAASARSTRSLNSSRVSRPAAVCRWSAATTWSRSAWETRRSGSVTSTGYCAAGGTGVACERSGRPIWEGGMAGSPGQGLLIIERILRDRDGIWRQITEERDLRGLTAQMLASSTVSLACYGAVLGASHSFAQALSSTVKLPLLFLATLTICLPTLYLFNLISAHSYEFFKLLNVSILVLTALVGLRFLTSGMRTLNDHQATVHAPPAVDPVPLRELVAVAAPVPPNGGGVGAAVPADPTPAFAPPSQPQPLPHPQPLPVRPVPVRTERSSSMTLLYIWILLFGFVGTQLGWTLRPFFGSPDQPFALFRHISGTFYSDIFHTIGRLLGGG